MVRPTTKAGGMTEATRAAWDDQARDFDDQPDHGLLDPEVSSAWSALLRQVLPAVPARILDLGSGAGSLAVLLGERGYDVLGVHRRSASKVLSARGAVRSARLATHPRHCGPFERPPRPG